MIEVGLAETSGSPGRSPHLLQEPPEALHREVRLGDLALSVGGPEPVVDPTVCPVGGRRVGQPPRPQGPSQGGALGPVVVEEGLIDVEENDAKAVQGPIWPDR